ncbi:SLAP domain-containing protein [Lactobacillus sp. HT06-2]|uniref:SLAP domain-containing protein n=1 Tax=Lactobacillus TaxID=1578 RepID=UPI00268EB273
MQSSGVVFDTAKNKTDVIKSLPNSEFNLSLTSNGAEIQIPIVFSASTTTPDTTSNPVIKYTLNGTTTTLTNDSVFQVAKGANFTPTDFYNTNGEEVKINAQQTDKIATPAILSVTSNDVNTSEEGRYYHVTLTATGLTQKTTSVTYTVLIASSAKRPIYGNGPISTYNIYGINVFPGSTTFKTGDEVYVADGTKTINNVSYSQVSTKSKADAAKSNIWVKTSDLTKPATPAGDTNVATHAVMVDSRAYDKNGNYLGHMYYAYNDIQYVPEVVTINGKTYYKVANKNEYVRVTNITGNQRTLRHNAYIYWSSYRRTPGTGKMYRGQTVTTYGPQMRFKNGKKYYRIEGCRNNNKRYIKAVNFY